MPRADEHEGPLADTEVKRAQDKAEARANMIMRADVAELTEGGAFLRFFGRFAHPVLFQRVPVSNGSQLAAWAGKRELVLDMVDAMEHDHPGFLERMLMARFDYARELNKAAAEPHEES